MTATTVPARTFTDNEELCARSRDTHLFAAGKALCGDGLPQPTWPACRKPGIWMIRGYEHLYCAFHTAVRLQAKATAEQMRREAEARRTAFYLGATR